MLVRMTFIAVLLVLSQLTDAAQAGNSCEGNGEKVKQFSGAVENVRLPCKYHALKQKCGIYFINVSPGNIYVHPTYYLDSVWLGLRNRETGEEWEGSLSNTAALKYLQGSREMLFNNKGGDLATDDILTIGKDDQSTWVEAKNGDFRLTLTPSDPGNPDSPATWKFECLVDFEAADYPNQICGGDTPDAVDTRGAELDLLTHQQTIFYDVFNKTEIAQTSPKCVEATRLMTHVCTEDLRRRAMVTCGQILSSDKSPSCTCASKGTCDPMDLFLDCMTWACSGFTDQASCDRLGFFNLVDP